MLQLAIRAVTPHQCEVRSDLPVASCSAPFIVDPPTVILTTNGAAQGDAGHTQDWDRLHAIQTAMAAKH